MAAEAYMLADGLAYGIAPDSTGSTLYLVRGLPVDQAMGDAGESLGVPKRDSEHPFNPNLICYDKVPRVINSYLPDAAVLVRVVYKPVNYSGLRTQFDSRIYDKDIKIQQPIIVETTGTGTALIGYKDIQRVGEYRESVNSTGGLALSEVSRLKGQNIGKLYRLDGLLGLNYLFIGCDAWKDSGNRTFVRSRFYRTSIVKPVPPGTFGPNTLGLPELTGLSEYVITQDSQGRHEVRASNVNPEDSGSDYRWGQTLPWL